MAKILVHLTHGPEEPQKAQMAFSVAKNAIDGGHTVTMLLAENFFPLVHGGAAVLPSSPDQRQLRESYRSLVAGGAKIELSGPPMQASVPKGKQMKGLPGFAVPEALLRLSVGQDRIFTY